jgi:myosin heavy subunit
MAMLDEECRTPSGTEEALVAKMHAQLDKSPFYSPPKRGAGAQGAQLDDARYDKLQFVITHYAGPVRYTAVDWLEKNRGNLRADLRKVVASSSCPLVSALFPPDPFETPADSGVREQRDNSRAESMSACGSAPAP